MTETLNRPEHPEHFSEVHHENGEALMCMSSGGECRVLVEVMPGYSPEEEQQLIASTTGALQAIDQFTGGKAADIFTGLHIKIGEDVAEGGAKAVAEENAVLLNGRKMLLSVAEMRQLSGAYRDEELAGFPDEQRPGGALEYTLVHEIGHVLDGQTKTGEAYHRVAASESPTKYGRETDEWHADNKDHEAFAEGFAHAVYGMPVSETMEATVRETIGARLREIAEGQANAAETTGVDTVSLKDMSQEQLSEYFDSGNIHNGSHFMSSADNERYQELCETDLKEAVRFLREKWSEYADHEYIQSFALVHWVGNSESGVSDLEQLLGDSRHEVEISTQGYRDDKSLVDNPRWLKAKFGVLVDGRVNLASNADIQTNQWHGLQEDDDVKRRKYTEWANRLMTNEENCVSPYEFAVDNWKATGIVIDPDTPDIDKVVALAKEHGLPVIDTRDNDLFAKQSETVAADVA